MICSCKKRKDNTLIFLGELRRLRASTKFSDLELKEMRTRLFNEIV